MKIICPNCSWQNYRDHYTVNTEISNDSFRCASCGAEILVNLKITCPQKAYDLSKIKEKFTKDFERAVELGFFMQSYGDRQEIIRFFHETDDNLFLLYDLRNGLVNLSFENPPYISQIECEGDCVDKVLQDLLKELKELKEDFESTEALFADFKWTFTTSGDTGDINV